MRTNTHTVTAPNATYAVPVDGGLNHWKDLTAADTLSRTPIKETSGYDFVSELEAYVSFVTSTTPAAAARLETIIKKLQQDSVCQQLGIAETVSSGNGPKFACTNMSAFAEFSRPYNFRQITSIPRYQESN